MYQLLRLAVAGLAASGALAATLPAAEAQPAAAVSSPCFRTSQIQNTKMAGSRTLYIRTSTRAVYRMDFGADCTTFDRPLAIHPVSNAGEVCHAIDLDVRVSDTGQMCNPVSLRQLSPDEVAAIPAKDQP